MPLRELFYVFEVIVGIAVITGIINYKKQYRPMLFLLILLIYTFISEGVAFWAAIVYRNSHPVNHVYNAISVLLFSIFFYDVIINEKIRKGLIIFGGLLVVFSVLDPIFFEDIFSHTANVSKAKTAYLFIAGSILMMQQLDIPGDQKVFKDPVFLAGLTLVWFNIVSSLFFFFNDLRNKYHLDLPILTYAHFFSNYVHYSIFILAMLNLNNYKSYERDLHG